MIYCDKLVKEEKNNLLFSNYFKFENQLKTYVIAPNWSSLIKKEETQYEFIF
jgi:hypothetical protein